jgi:hypothetical protein
VFAFTLDNATKNGGMVQMLGEKLVAKKLLLGEKNSCIGGA